MTRLDGLKLSDKRTPWNTARKTLKAMKEQARTDAMVQSLDTVKQQLDVRLLIC